MDLLTFSASNRKYQRDWSFVIGLPSKTVDLGRASLIMIDGTNGSESPVVTNTAIHIQQVLQMIKI